MPKSEESNVAAPEILSGELDLKERNNSLVGRIANEIARSITDGILKPGADLNSVDLAVRFRTSRTPIREALMILEKEGLVDIQPRRRPRVANISLQEVEQIYEIRATLNSLMIKLYVRNASPASISHTISSFEKMKEFRDKQDFDGFAAARSGLHNHWAENCGNANLLELLRTWKMRMSVSRLVGRRGNDMSRSIQDHERIVLAIAERDEPLAAELIRAMTIWGFTLIKRDHQLRQGGA
ncbi:GntR family transcriptional regulator [Croceicoccus ponticola]|uniref:GntR family transcriptional regulator n=1 Tax=Croceicoccus ponticola TaxID=2217664 RepID=A0A437H205_9SPHN|nr:GntR family transcriptional regulator [Croceicoccus ponticola]RVQ69655.1 GntR family transcriptional regulator [Croceicoccus ponticola]